MGLLRELRPPRPRLLPSGSKVPHYGVYRVSKVGIVTMVLGRYLLVGYLDP